MQRSNHWIPAVALAVTGVAGVAAAQCPSATAEYRLQFDASWSAATHPVDFPTGPHFSGLIGGVHNSSVTFWEPGGLASTGIERMAELGSKTALTAEIDLAIAAGDARAVVSGGGIGLSPGSVTVTFAVSQDHPLVSVVSMLAPSPDWFVGVSGLPLFVAGDWIDQTSVTLYAYDAGTDSGPSYRSANDDTDPPGAIALLDGFPLLHEGEVAPVGLFTFERLTPSCDDTDGDGVPDATDNCTLLHNPAQRDTDGDAIGNVCDADIAPATNDCTVNFLDLNAMKAAFFSSPGVTGWNADADLSGDNVVGFSDLARMKAAFFDAPGPSAAGCN